MFDSFTELLRTKGEKSTIADKHQNDPELKKNKSCCLHGSVECLSFCRRDKQSRDLYIAESVEVVT